MADTYVLVLAASLAMLVPVFLRHRQITREKRVLLARLERLAQHRDLIQR